MWKREVKFVLLMNGTVNQHPEEQFHLIGTQFKKETVSDRPRKKEAAVQAVCSATSDVERKKAIEAQAMLNRYGTSCFLKLLDDEAAPSEDRTQRARDEQLAKAKAMKSKFQHELSSLYY